MNASLIRLRDRVNALTTRERVMLFATMTAIVLFVFYPVMLDPLLVRQKALRATIAQQQNNMQGIDAEIVAAVEAHAIDPDVANRARLQAIKTAGDTLNAKLLAVQNGLVPPERIAPLLETILRSNGRLQLVSLKSLPAMPLVRPAAAGTAAAPPAASRPVRQIYTHGVQVVVRGNYLDMIDYMDALEAMPTQLFWSKASLEVEEYPNARLSLTLYTLSLDQKWMKL